MTIGIDNKQIYNQTASAQAAQNARFEGETEGLFDNETGEVGDNLSVDDMEMLYEATENAKEAQDLADEAGIDTNISDGDFSLENIDELNAELERLIETGNKALDELEERKALLESEQAIYDEQSAKYNETLEELNEKQDEYDEIQEAIENATKDYQDSEARNRQQAIYKAMAEYNEQEDGDWNSYLQKELKGVVGDSAFQTLISDLSGSSKSAARELGGLQVLANSQKTMMDASKAIVDSVSADIQSLQDTVSVCEASIQTVRNKILEAITNSISEEEMALVEANNIDLTEKMEDGSPRYVFAKGKSDGQFHIYDLQQGATLARLYADGQGFDIVESGNGYINGFEKLDDSSGGETVYYIGDCGSACSFNACYTTSSPLSFDIDGNGIATTNEVVDFDIDGDGIMDKINNSADAVLVFDKDGDGISGADGSECFGDNTDIDGDGTKDGYKDGFEALKALAAEAGVVNGADDMVIDADDIKLLEEQYGLKIKTEGYNSEAQSLLDIGITEINLANTDETTLIDNFDDMGNQIMYQEGATFKIDGEEREYADIWHRKYEE